MLVWDSGVRLGPEAGPGTHFKSTEAMFAKRIGCTAGALLLASTCTRSGRAAQVESPEEQIAQDAVWPRPAPTSFMITPPND